MSGLRPIADDYELADDKLPAAQQASAELLRCRFQAVLAKQILLQDLVRPRCGSFAAGICTPRRGLMLCCVIAAIGAALLSAEAPRRTVLRLTGCNRCGATTCRTPPDGAHALPQVPGLYIACFASGRTLTGRRSTHLQHHAAHSAAGATCSQRPLFDLR